MGSEKKSYLRHCWLCYCNHSEMMLDMAFSHPEERSKDCDSFPYFLPYVLESHCIVYIINNSNAFILRQLLRPLYIYV